MKKAALILMMSLLAAPPGMAAAQTATTEALPVSMERIRKALNVDPTLSKPQEPVLTPEQPDVPQFATQVTSDTIKLRWYLDDGTAVPAYVRAPFDPVHYEFLEMVTPDAAKGCNAVVVSDAGCAGLYSQRALSAIVWQQLFAPRAERGIKRLFSR